MSAAATDPIDLPTAATEILEEAHGAKAGRAGRTLTPGAGAPLKQVLLGLVSGAALADHESPGDATIQILSGKVHLTAGGPAILLEAGAYMAIPPVRHGVEAMEDAVLLLTVAQAPNPT